MQVSGKMGIRLLEVIQVAIGDMRSKIITEYR